MHLLLLSELISHDLHLHLHFLVVSEFILRWCKFSFVTPKWQPPNIQLHF